jgi:hypothetical protein
MRVLLAVVVVMKKGGMRKERDERSDDHVLSPEH